MMTFNRPLVLPALCKVLPAYIPYQIKKRIRELAIIVLEICTYGCAKLV